MSQSKLQAPAPPLKSRLQESASLTRRWLVSFVIAASFVALTYTILGAPIFETNDDINMAMISAGIGTCDKPDPHLFISAFPFGLALSSLYSALPTVPWYGLSLLTAQILSLAVIIVVLWSTRNTTRLGAAITIGTLLLFGCLRPIALMQFTTTAALLASAGALLVLRGLEQTEKRRLTMRSWLFAALLLAAAAVLRKYSADLILFLLSVAIALRFGLTRRWRTLATGIVLITCFAGMNFAIDIANQLYYSRGEWRDFYALNSLHGGVREFGRFQGFDDSNVRAFEAAGWDWADVNMLRCWYMLDETVYSTENFKTVDRLTPLVPKNLRLARVAGNLSATLFSDCTITPSVVLILSLALIASAKFPLPARLSYTAILLGFCTFMLVETKLPERVLCPALTFSILLLLFYNPPASFSTLIRNNIRNKILLSTAGLILIALMVRSGLELQDRINRSNLRGAKLLKAIEQLNPKPEDLYIDWAGSIPREVVTPFDDLSKYFGRMHLLDLNSNGRSPLVQARMDRWGITDLAAQLDKPRVYLVLSGKHLTNAIHFYCLRRFGRYPIFEKVFSDPEVLAVYKVRGYLRPSNCDLSDCCPRLGDGDIELFPERGKSWKYDSVELVKADGKTSTFETSGNLPALVWNEPTTIDPTATPWLCVEERVNSFVKNRTLRLIYAVEGSATGDFQSMELLPDSKFHTYAFDLRKLANPGQHITYLSILPLDRRPEDSRDLFSIKQIGLVRENRPIKPSSRQ